MAQNELSLSAADLANLRNVPMFRFLDDDITAAVLAGATPRRWSAGQTILEQDHPLDAFYVVLEGWVKLYRITRTGEEAVLSVMTAGESFAEAVVFMGGRCPVSVDAVGDVRLLRIEYAALRRAIERDGATALALLASIAHQGEALTDQVDRMKTMTAPRRVADFFLALALRLRSPAETGAAELRLPYEKALIAARLGMTPESFSRAVAQLRRHGVAVERDRVRIASLERLGDWIEDGAD
jgi:CRP-like cAMP-binding protein